MKNFKETNTSNKLASYGARLAIYVYLLLAVSKLTTGTFFNSASVFADGLNNLSDIISNLAIFIGLYISNKPKDDDHHFDHNKYEALASFIVAIIMTNIGFDVIKAGILRFINKDFPIVNINILWVSILSSIILFFCYKYIQNIAKETNSLGLKASSQDMLNDIVISASTILGTLSARFGYPMIDTLIAICVGILTIFSAIDILKKSSFVLSDGFNKEDLTKYKQAILSHPKIYNVPKIRARISGIKVYVDVIIEIDGHLTVTESHKITEDVEQILKSEFNVDDTDVHVEPFIKFID